MIISLLVAMDENRGIGLQGGIPWHLPDDLKHFRALTMGHHVVMGRKTYESIGKPLPGRKLVIVTRNPSYRPVNCEEPAGACLTVHSLEAALDAARSRGEDEVFVIGGGEIFAQALPLSERLYLTLVHGSVPADTFFPAWPEEDWVEVSSRFHPQDERHAYPFTFKTLERPRREPVQSLT